MYLNLSGNQLSGPVPAELASLTDLRLLQLDDNQLSGPVPAELASLPDLATLRLGDNDLLGPIPDELLAIPDDTRHLHYRSMNSGVPLQGPLFRMRHQLGRREPPGRARRRIVLTVAPVAAAIGAVALLNRTDNQATTQSEPSIAPPDTEPASPTCGLRTNDTITCWPSWPRGVSWASAGR